MNIPTLEQLKTLYRERKYERLALGLALGTGGLLALSSGAVGVAGVMFATRTALSALGGFMTTEAVFDIVGDRLDVNKDTKNYQRARVITASTVAGVMAILGGSEILEGSTATVQEVVPMPQKVEMPTIPAPEVPTINTTSIFEDILKDHPKQGYITLEQSVRRIEGLKMGIALDESEKLKTLNTSISQMVHDPSGKIITSLRHLGYLSENQTLDEIAPKLTKEQIDAVLHDVYDEKNPQVVEPIPPEVPAATSLPSSFIHTEQDAGNLPLIISASVGALAIGSALWYGKGQNHPENRENSIDRMVDSINPQTPAVNTINNDTENTGSNDQDSPLPPAGDNNPPPIPLNTREASTPLDFSVMKRVLTPFFDEEYGWSYDEDRSVLTPHSSRLIFTGTTLGGSYDAIIQETSQAYTIYIVWYDHDVRRYHKQSEPIGKSSLTSQNLLSVFGENLESMFLDVLLKREELKTLDSREIESIAFQKEELGKLYRHVEHPEVLRNRWEVLGYLLGSTYSISNKILPMITLTTPPIEHQELTHVTSVLRAEDAANHLYNPRLWLLKTNFQKKEYKLLFDYFKQHIITGELPGGDRIPLPGMFHSYNWHKHPPGLGCPSAGDINIAPDMFKREVHLQILFFMIVMPITNESERREAQAKNWLVLDKNTYGGMYSYTVRPFIIRRKPEGERYSHHDLKELSVLNY